MRYACYKFWFYLFAQRSHFILPFFYFIDYSIDMEKGSFSNVISSCIHAVLVILIPICMFFICTSICPPNHVFNMIREPTQLQNLKTLTLPAVAGKYFNSNGYSTHDLNIKPDGTYNYTYAEPGEGTYEESSGIAKITDGYVILIANRVLKAGTGMWCSTGRVYYKPVQPVVAKFIPIQWDGRLYFIKPDEMIDFCIAIENGKEQGTQPVRDYRQPSDYYLKDNDWKKPVTGLPSFPPPWDSLKFNRPST